MNQRCNNPNATRYHRYGGRGITIFKEWEIYLNFKTWALNNNWEKNLTIDRIDVNKNYCPTNCRWISNKENTKLSSIYHKENKTGMFSKEANEKSKQTNRLKYGVKVKVFNETENFICESLGEAAEILSKKLDRKFENVYSHVKQVIKGKANGISTYRIETIETTDLCGDQ